MWRLEYCTETTLAVTTGAYKSRPLIITAVVLSCSILQLSVRRTSVSSLCNPKPNVSPLFLLWTLKTFIAYVSLVCTCIFEGFQVYIYIWVSRYYRYRWILYLHPTLMHLIKNASLPHCDILWNVSIQCHCFLFFFSSNKWKWGNLQKLLKLTVHFVFWYEVKSACGKGKEGVTWLVLHKSYSLCDSALCWWLRKPDLQFSVSLCRS